MVEEKFLGKFSIEQALNFAWAKKWEALKLHLFQFLLCLPFLLLHLLFVSDHFSREAMFFLITAPSLLWFTYTYLGLLSALLILAHTGQARWQNIFSLRGKTLLYYIGYSLLLVLGLLCYAFATATSSVPFALLSAWSGGVISVIFALIALSLLLGVFAVFVFLAIRVSLATYVLVDQKVDPLESLNTSYELTHGTTPRLMVFWLLTFCMNFLGLLCLGVGLFLTVPLTYLASIHVYLSLLQNKEQSV